MRPHASAPEPLILAPVVGVEHGHVAEAARALRAEGRQVDEADVHRYLWVARALPACLDLLTCAHSSSGSRWLERAVFAGVRVEGPGRLESDGVTGPLVASAAAGDDRESIVVRFFPRTTTLTLQQSVETAKRPSCTVRFLLAPPQDDEEATVTIHRFSLSHPS